MATILGVPFSTKTMKEAIDVVHQHLETATTPFHVVTANPEIVMNAKRNRKFRILVKEADMVTADGIGVVIGSRILKQGIPERVAGADLIKGIWTKRGEEKKRTKLFLLGAKEESVSVAAKNVQEQYPHIDVVGYHHGYFQPGSDTEAEIVKTISTLQPDMILVGFGSPRQEEFISTYKNDLRAKVLIGCGGVIDVLSGTVKRAPVFFQKMNLEWAWRLLSQPTRWKRQLDIPRFLIEVMKEKRKSM